MISRPASTRSSSHWINFPLSPPPRSRREDRRWNLVPKRRSSPIHCRYSRSLWRKGEFSFVESRASSFDLTRPISPFFCQPESVNITNVSRLFDAEGKPHFKVIVEGANLFFTQQARLYLEKRGVILFKDSSTNKVSSQFIFRSLPLVRSCS